MRPSAASLNLGWLALIALGCACTRPPASVPEKAERAPPRQIIDTHLHALTLWDREAKWYPKDLSFPTSDDALRTQTLAELAKHNIVKAVTSGPPDVVEVWRAADPARIIPGVMFGEGVPLDDLRQLVKEGKVQVFGELIFQYQGLRADDPKIEPYLALADELDIPVAWHLGIGPMGIAHQMPYTIEAGNPLHLEAVLKKHPKLRLQVMHAGWPLLDEMLAILYQYENVYVDIAVINWYLPRAEFHAYLRRLVEAGYTDRIMWGSDQMMWPGAIARAIDNVQTADFITDEQRRAIFYDNAARFFRI